MMRAKWIGRAGTAIVTAMLAFVAGCSSKPDLTPTAEEAPLAAKIEVIGGRYQVAHAREGRPIITVNVSGCKLSDSDIDTIAQFKELERLVLTSTNVTDEQLKKIHSMTTLTEIELSVTAVSKKAVDELKRALPNAEITHSAAPRPR